MFSPLRCGASFLLAAVLIPVSAFAQTFNRATTSFTGPGPLVPTVSVAFGNGTFVSLGLKGRPSATANAISAYTSTDGNVWTERVINIPNVSVNNHGVVRFIGGQFIFTGTVLNPTGTQAYVARSVDGISWTVTNPDNLSPLNGFAEIVTGNGTSVGFFATTLSSSSDAGVSWTARSAPGVVATAPYTDLAYGAGRYVLLAAGTTTKVWTSPDAVTWTEILAGQQNAGRLAFGNGLFVLSGANYKTSTDGINFTVRPTPTNFNLTGTVPIYFKAGRFFQFAFSFTSLGQPAPGRLVGSSDGVTWTPFATFAPDLMSFSPLDFAEGNNRLVAVGYESTGTLFAPLRPAVVAVLDITNLPALPTAPAAPVVTTQPTAANAVAGGSATFTVAASGTGNTYQWRKDGQPIAGATAATLTVSNITAANAGAYSVVITNSIGTTASAAATLTLVTASNSGRLVNLSVRTAAGTGDNTLIVGLGLGGAGTSGSKAVLIRGVGPTLSAFGVPGLLADPVMTLFQGQTQSAQNDDWAGGFDFSSVGAFAYSGTPVRDAALYNPALASGSYSIQITGKNNATGIALAEIYDATSATAFAATTPRLVNVSARTQVGTGDNILIAGFSISGSTAVRILIRAVGPTLGAAPFNVGGTLADPKLEIYSGSTKTIENDNWAGTAELKAAFSAVAAFALSADNSRDAALVATLQPGSYTAQISGIGNTTGVALVELYELP